MGFTENDVRYLIFIPSVPAVIRSGTGSLQATEPRRRAPAVRENPASLKEDVRFVERAISFQDPSSQSNGGSEDEEPLWPFTVRSSG